MEMGRGIGLIFTIISLFSRNLLNDEDFAEVQGCFDFCPLYKNDTLLLTKDVQTVTEINQSNYNEIDSLSHSQLVFCFEGR